MNDQSIEFVYFSPSRSDLDLNISKYCAVKYIAVALIVLFSGCNSSVPNAAFQESAPNDSSTSKERSQRQQHQNLPKEAPGMDQDVLLVLNVVELPNKRVSLNGKTNLPTGTKLSLVVSEKLENGFLGQSSSVVLPDGSFRTVHFGPKGGLKDGWYSASVTMPVAAVQPEAVKKVIGEKGEWLKGRLVTKGVLGATVSQQEDFSIGAMPDAAQAKRKQQIEAKISSVKLQLCQFLEQLLDFKDEPQFKKYGFAAAGPYNEWYKEVEALRDALTTESGVGPTLLRATPAYLLLLGNDYIKGETDYTTEMLPHIKETIEFEEYLNTKNGKSLETPIFRTWLDSTGRHKTVAALVALKGEKVVLLKKDGSTITVPLEKLDPLDIEFVKKQLQ